MPLLIVHFVSVLLLTPWCGIVIVPPLIVFLIGHLESLSGIGPDLPPGVSARPQIATAQFTVHGRMKRRPFLLLCASSLLAGCSSWSLFSSSTSNVPGETAEDQPHTVGDLAIPFGMFPVKIEAIGLVSGLHGTGSDPEPSPQRANAHRRNAAAQGPRSQRPAGHAQFLARAGPRHPAAGHSEGRPFRRGIASQGPQRDQQPARRLPCWKPPCRTWL